MSAPIAGNFPNSAIIVPAHCPGPLLSQASILTVLLFAPYPQPCGASDKEQKKALVEHPINVHEYTVKTHEFSGVYFHLKEWPRQGPTKLSIALSAEGSHRAGSLAQRVTKD